MASTTTMAPSSVPMRRKFALRGEAPRLGWHTLPAWNGLSSQSRQARKRARQTEVQTRKPKAAQLLRDKTGKQSFLAKEHQKTLVSPLYSSPVALNPARLRIQRETRVFCFFFAKKQALPFYFVFCAIVRCFWITGCVLSANAFRSVSLPFVDSCSNSFSIVWWDFTWPAR